MRVGILTFHRAINYGAVLQTYALQEVLRGLGHEVVVIDYRQPRVERTDRRPYRNDDKGKLLKGLHLRSWWNYEKDKKLSLAIRQRFDNFLHTFLHLTSPCTKDNIPVLDAYIVGSDQVWNSAICDGLDPVFWGAFNRPVKSKLISYAASTSVNDLNQQDNSKVIQLLQNFDFVSVREESSCKFINENFKIRGLSKTVLDPTLLADSSIWSIFDDSKNRDEKYVLYFGARSCTKYPSVLLDKAQSLASDLGCEVQRVDFNSDTPVDFVNKFRYAQAVITSSFHGVMFSLIFNRSLYAVKYGDEQDARYVNVLKSIGAESMLVELRQDVNPQYYDYTTINAKLKEVRKYSLDFLKCL